MDKWDITLVQWSPDADAVCTYSDIYRLALGSMHRNAIRALFLVQMLQCRVFMDLANVLFWNVHGLNSKALHDVVTEMVAQERVSMLCLQETKLNGSSEHLLSDMLDSSFVYETILANGSRGGILVAWHAVFWSVCGVSHSPHSITLKILVISSIGV
jgi:hypothetical protein